VVVETGDMVCLHTGFAQMLLEMNGKPDAHTLLEHSCACSMAATASCCSGSPTAVCRADRRQLRGRGGAGDARALNCCATLPLHEHCLFKLGMHLGEIWHLTPLADWLRAHGRNRFLLTAPPLRLPGAVGSPATPIATV
jgi:hypothetical protein